MTKKPRRLISFSSEENPVQLVTFEKEEAWLAARRGYMTSSDAAVVMGVNPWKSAVELYLEKTGQALPAPPTEARQEAMALGQLLESTVAQRFADVTRRELFDYGRQTLHVNKNYPLAAATVDRVITSTVPGYTGPGILECKSTGGWAADEWDQAPPLMYIMQLQHQLMVTGCSWGTLAVLIGGTRMQFKYFDMKRNTGLVKELYKAEVDFFEEYVSRRLPPPPDGSASAARAIKYLYPNEDGTSVDLDPQTFEPVHLLLEEAKRKKKEAQAIIDANETLLKAAIGPHSFGRIGPELTYSLLTTERAGYTVQATSFRSLKMVKAKKGARA